MMHAISLEQWFNYAGVFVFAATGALVASRRQLDLVAFLFLASITGIGGGTLRDLVLGSMPVIWVKDPGYLLACAAAAVSVYFTAHLFESRYRLLLWLDAIGLAAYCVMGADKSLTLGYGPIVAVVTGVLTATFGGILRDVVAGEPSVLMRKEVYVTAALAGAVVYTIMHAVGLTPQIVSAVVAAGVAFIIRGGALQFSWTLPTHSRRGRTEEQLRQDGIIGEE